MTIKIRFLISALIGMLALLPLIHAQDAEVTYTANGIKHGAIELLSFEDFELTIGRDNPLYKPKQEWYRIYIGFSYHTEEPPGEAFILDSLPPGLEKNAVLIEIKTLSDKKFIHSNYFIVDHDPLFRKLKKPFPLGSVVYTRIKKDNENGITLAYYYYDSGEITWLTKNTPQPSEYKLDLLEVMNEVVVPAGKWYIRVLNSKSEEHIVNNKVTLRKLYRYMFIRVSRI